MKTVFGDKRFHNDPTERFWSLPPAINNLSEAFRIIVGKI